MADPTSTRTGYTLGVDLGTTYSAAAIMRGSAVEACVLGTIAAQIPSVVVHREDGEILTGEAAERRAGSEPTRAAREFKRRLGDPVPIIVGGTPYGAEALMAEMLAAIVHQVTDREGAPPTTVVLTHPANYTEYKRGLLREAARLAGLDLASVRLITEPEAAAIAYARQQRIDGGEVIAVYDFGGGTFDAAVVRDTPTGFELIGVPEGMERLGGIDFDQAVLAHVDAALDGMVSAADGTDPQVAAGQARLRDDCRRAKEALSNDTDATIAVSIPGIQTDVRLTRDELEQMVRPRVAETVRALQRTIASAGLSTDDVSRVLLVGGSSRMPIVAQIIRESIGRPVSVDADPKLTIAMGAALSTLPRVPDAEAVAGPEIAPPKPVAQATNGSRRAGGTRRKIAIPAAIAVGALVAVGIVIVVRGRGSDASTGHTAASTVPRAVGLTTTVPALSTALPTVVTTSPPAATTSAVPTQTSATSPVSPVSPVSTVSTGAAADGPVRFAFDGTASGLGIPGPAATAGAPALLTGIAIAANGDVHVISSGPTILRVRSGQVTVEGALSAAQTPPAGIAVGSDGVLFVSTPVGVVRITDGVSEVLLDPVGAGLSARLGPVALDGGGNLYIADNGTARIIRRAPDGTLTLVAGTGTPAVAGSTVADGPAATTDIGMVSGLLIDRAGNLLIADATLDRVRAVGPDGTMTTVASGSVLSSTAGIAVSGDRSVYVADTANHAIVRFAADGTSSVAASNVAVTAVAITPSGSLIFTDGTSLWSLGGSP